MLKIMFYNSFLELNKPVHHIERKQNEKLTTKYPTALQQ